MFHSLRCLFLLLPIAITGISIPFISNVILLPRYLSNFTIVDNRSIDQCLCLSLPSFVAFNWFPNKTCQLFRAFPVSYRIQSIPQARLYFPQGVFPNASQCCMPDLGYLLGRFVKATVTFVSVTAPRNLILDNNGYVVLVGGQTPTLSRFDAGNLTLISQTMINGSFATAVGFVDNAYFVGFDEGVIAVIDSGNLTVLRTLISPFIRGVRGIIFLDQGRTMVTSAMNNQAIVFFNRSATSPFDYAFAYQKSVSYSAVYGLNRINDTFFYATSWTQNSVYSYSLVPHSSLWSETLVIDARPIWNTTGGTFVTTDECGRHWFSLEASKVYIFDSQGTWLGSLGLTTGQFMDTLITDNYVMYLADGYPHRSRIIRIDPQIQC